MSVFIVYQCELGNVEATKQEVMRYKREWQASKEVKHRRRYTSGPNTYVWYERADDDVD